MLKTILVAATLAMAVLPAQAAVMQAVYTGTILDSVYRSETSYDYTGLFGSIRPLKGLGVRATFTYDTDAGYRITRPWGEYIRGGSSYGVDYPPFFMSAKITIAGHSASTTGEYNSIAATYNYGDEMEIYHRSSQTDITGSLFSSIIAWIHPREVPYNLHTPYHASRLDDTVGQFFFARNDGEAGYQAIGVFYVNHVSITKISPAASQVPLPASFGMGFAALAGLVLMGRRRRAA